MKRRFTHATLLILSAGLAVMVATAQTSTQTGSTSQSSSGGSKFVQGSASGSASGSGQATSKGSGSGSGSGNVRFTMPTHAVAYSPGSQFRSITDTGKQRALKAQAEYLMKLAQEGKVTMSGPWRDEPGGLTLLHVRTDQEAREIVANDPAVMVNLYEADLRAWTVNILGSGKAFNIGK